MLGFSKDGKDAGKQDNRSRSDRLEKQSAKTLGGRQVKGSGSSKYSKGDLVTHNPSAPRGVGYNYQQKSSISSSKKASVSINRELLDKTNFEAAQSNRTPVLEIILDNRDPWYCVPLEVWQALSGERGG